MKLLFVFTLLACVLTATPARADALFIKGATSPAEENVLFNQPGLISTGNTVQGRTELTNLVLNFTFFQGRLALTTTSPGEPRIDAPGFVFNSLRFRFDDPLVSFTELDFAINADQVGSITFTALTMDGSVFSGVSTLDAPFINPFSVVAIGGQRLREVSYTSPAPFTVDVRRIRVGGVAIQATPIPEPGTLALLASSLIPLAGAILRRRKT
jgi:hypothetical protein